MWITLLVMAVAVSLEPFRIGMTVLMINRPRPLLQLLAFLAGGFAMGTAVGVIVLFVLRPALGSAHFTLPRVQIVVGAVVLVNAAVVGHGRDGRQARRRIRERADRMSGPLATRTRQLLNGRSLWTAGVAGLGIALPSVDYLAALALIVASGAAAATQVGALHAVQRGGVRARGDPAALLPGGPGPHPPALSALNDWLRSRRPPRGRRPAGRGRLRAARRRARRTVGLSDSGVQPGELVLAVLLDAGGAPDLAARRGGNRPWRDQHEIPDIQAVRIGYRGGDVALDPAEPVHRVYRRVVRAS